MFIDVTGSGIGGSVDAKIAISAVGISSYIGDVVQITGDGQTADAYHRITDVGHKTITVARGVGDPTLNADQYAFVVGQSVGIVNTVFGESTTIIDGETSVTVGIVTFTTSESHGLAVGNKFRAIDSSNNNAGDYIVENIISSTEFRVKTSEDLSTSVANGFILKHGLSSNEGISDIRTESYAARTVQFYGGETFKLTGNYSAGNSNAINFTCLTGSNVDKRLKLGDFLQVKDEILRVSGDVTNTSAVVSRGYLGTRQGNHVVGDIMRKIKPIPIEFRRPTICRASAHTFEYLGYGPGNYSTALPQVQVKTLSEREDFLVQAQERSAGAVIYTGMNSKGDTFNGNTKVSAASGETISYDIPKPTITGQDPSKLSVAFDEVTIRERILVEGGESGFVLSQFDGPVTMTRQLRVKGKATFNSQVRITFKSTAINENSGSLVVKGGVGIGDNSYISGTLTVTNDLFLRGHLEMSDDKEIRLGDDDDFILKYVNSTDESKIVSTASSISVKSDGDVFILNSDSAEMVKITESNSTVDLQGELTLRDDKKIKLGDSSDLNIYHNGTHSYIDENGNGASFIRSINGNSVGGDGAVIIATNDASSEDDDDVVTQARFYSKNSDGDNTYGVRLYYNGSPTNQATGKRFETREDRVQIYKDLDVENNIIVGDDIYPDDNLTGNVGTRTKAWGEATIGHIFIGQTGEENETEGYYNYIESWHPDRDKLDLNLRAKGDGKIHINSRCTIEGATRIKSTLDVDNDITAFYSASDINLKENIEKIDDPLAKVLSISGNTFTWKEDAKYEGDDTGVIAQEIEALGLPGIVKQQEDGHKSVQYHKLIPVLIEAVKELSDKVEKLEQQNQDK